MRKLFVVLLMVLALLVGAVSANAQEGVVKWNAVPKTVAVQSNFGFGTGVFVTGDGYIVTCKHVVYGAEKILVYDSEFNEYGARIVGYHSETDIAVLKIYPTEPVEYFDRELQVANPNQIFQMDTVYTIGHPLGLVWSITKGIISGVRQGITGIRYYQIDAPINPGNSGGALVNAHGQLIGINAMGAPAFMAENIGLAIAVGSFAEEVELIITEDMDRLGIIEDVRKRIEKRRVSYYNYAQ